MMVIVLEVNESSRSNPGRCWKRLILADVVARPGKHGERTVVDIQLSTDNEIDEYKDHYITFINYICVRLKPHLEIYTTNFIHRCSNSHRSRTPLGL